jgi:hypothetical protein
MAIVYCSQMAICAHICDECGYSTNRSFNFKRHMRMMHGIIDEYEEPTIDIDAPKTNKHAPNVAEDAPNVAEDAPNVAEDAPNINSACVMSMVINCPTCYKTFTHRRSLKRHSVRCTHKLHRYQCTLCDEVFEHASALSRHKKTCNGQHASNSTVSSANGSQVAEVINNTNIGTNINTQNNIQNQNNTVNLLVFPEDVDSAFDFITSHITKGDLHKLLKSHLRPSACFGKFAGAVLEAPPNRCVKKSGPNVSHSQIHVGNNEWELALDKDVYPILTHHITTAALTKINEFKDSMHTLFDAFHRYVDTVNTDEDSEEYMDSVQRIKLMVINMSRRWAREQGIDLSV